MNVSNLTQFRHFRDVNGVRWRVNLDGYVQRWSQDARQWVQSNYRLDQLESHAEIREVSAEDRDL